MVIFVGYNVKIKHNDLLKYVPDTEQKDAKIVAAHHHSDSTQQHMIQWYETNKLKQHVGILKGIYINRTKKMHHVIGIIFFNGKPLTIILHNDSKMTPLDLKINANRGAYGKIIPVNITLDECTAVIV